MIEKKTFMKSAETSNLIYPKPESSPQNTLNHRILSPNFPGHTKKLNYGSLASAI